MMVIFLFYVDNFLCRGNLKANGPTLSANPDPSDINSHVHIRHVSVHRPPLHAPQQVPLSPRPLAPPPPRRP